MLNRERFEVTYKGEESIFVDALVAFGAGLPKASKEGDILAVVPPQTWVEEYKINGESVAFWICRLGRWQSILKDDLRFEIQKDAEKRTIGNSHDDGPDRAIRDVQGKVYMHPGTGHLYRVQGYGWDAERNRWVIRYVATGFGKRDPDGGNNIDYFHLPEDFFRPGRFLEVKQW